MDAHAILRSADARVRLDLLAPAPPRIAAELRAPPRGLDATLAAKAVGYMLRFELQRRTPGAQRGTWLAEDAPAQLATRAPELVDEAAARLGAAKHELTRYAAEPAPGPRLRAAMAAHALALGRLDAAARAGYIDERIRDRDDAEEVADVLAMADAFPWEELATGADALGDELVARGVLLDVKATKVARVDADDVRALVLRFLLLRAREPELAARVERLGVLLARHGHLWTAPASAIVTHEARGAVESWLAERLREAEDPKAGARRRPGWVKDRLPDKAPMTHPEGKAQKKKSGKPPAPGAPPPARSPSRAKASEPDAPSAPRRTPRPDWRKGSQWRRERGL